MCVINSVIFTSIKANVTFFAMSIITYTSLNNIVRIIKN